MDKMKEMHVQLMKEILPLKNSLREKEARLVTLKTADKPDMNAINKQIDEISVVKASIAKKQAALEQEIRKILTDEQRIFFDSHQSRENGHDGMKPPKPHHPGMDMDKPDKPCDHKDHKTKKRK